MRLYRSILLSVVAVAVPTFFTIKSVITFPQSSGGWWLSFIALALGSILIGIAANYFIIRDANSLKEGRRQIEELYRSVKSVLWDGLQDILRRRTDDLLAKPSMQSRSDHPLKFYVFARMENRYKIVASTVHYSEQVWTIALKDDEGIVGFTADHGITVLADVAASRGVIFDPAGAEVGTQKPLDPTNRARCDVDVKWIYAIPIFERSNEPPHSDMVIGILTVDSSQAEDEQLFKSTLFQRSIQTIAFDVAPYLAAVENLIEKSKAQRMIPV